jgi:hypothetical protein
MRILIYSAVFLLCALLHAGCSSPANPDDQSVSFVDIITRPDPYSNAELSYDGSLFAYVEGDVGAFKTLKVVDTRTGGSLFSSPLELVSSWRLQFNRDDSLLISSLSIAGAGGPTIVRNAYTGQVLCSLSKASSAIFMPDGRSVLAIEKPSSNLVQYDALSGAELNRFTQFQISGSNVRLAGTSADGKRVFYTANEFSPPSGPTVGYWDLATGTSVSHHTFPPYMTIELSKDAMRWYLYRHTYNSGKRVDSIQSYDALTYALLHEREVGTGIACLISPDGSSIANQPETGNSSPVGLYRMDNGALLRTFPSEGLICEPACFSGDGSHLAASWHNGRADGYGYRIWKLK